MQITYIRHSGFLVETKDVAMLFDFAEGNLPALPNGKPLFVFVSHIHGDHYAKRIFTEVPAAAEKAGEPSLTYVLSADVPKRDVPAALQADTIFLKPHELWETPAIRIETLVSNDTGVAFVLDVPDGKENGETAFRKIYFAGDLNAWNWDGDEEDMELIRIYHEELAHIKGVPFDVAFIPLDPRLGDDDTQGITDFFETCSCDARAIVPMHCWGKYDIMPRARKKLADKPYAARMLSYSREGEVLTFSS